MQIRIQAFSYIFKILLLISLVFVEGLYGGPCLYPDYLLHAVGCFLYGMDLTRHVLGEFARELVVFGATAHIRLL